MSKTLRSDGTHPKNELLSDKVQYEIKRKCDGAFGNLVQSCSSNSASSYRKKNHSNSM